MTMKLVTVSPVGGGVIRDLLASELKPESWSASLNMRFANGFAICRDGIASAFANPAATPYSMALYPAIAGRFLVFSTLGKVYANDGAAITEITRQAAGQSIASITRVGTTATLTTATAHGLSSGASVTVSGASPSQYNGTYSITVTGATTFTYTMASDPGASASPVGLYSYTSNFSGNADDRCKIFVFNGILIYNNPIDGPYYWNGDITTKLQRLPDWPAGQTAYSMLAFKNYLIAIAPTIGGTFYPHRVMWSASAQSGAVPTSWTAAATNDAGDTPQLAETGGALVDAEVLGDSVVIYKKDSRWSMDWVGGTAVFAFRRLPGAEGLISRGCVVAMPKGHVFMSGTDVLLHNGGEAVSLMEGRNRLALFDGLDSGYIGRSFLVANHRRSEVWVVFVRTGQTVPDAVWAWSWKDDTWGYFELPAATCGCSGLIPSAAVTPTGTYDGDAGTWDAVVGTYDQGALNFDQQNLVLGHTTPRFGLANTGFTDFGAAVSWNLEKRGTTLGDSDSMKVVSRTRIQADAPAGTAVNVSVATTLTADADPMYQSPAIFTVGASNFANRFSKAGRFMSFKLAGQSSAGFALRSYDAEYADQRGRF